MLVADRAFCSFPHLCLLSERGVQIVVRVLQLTIVDFDIKPTKPLIR